ncbi:Manganese-dependent ADP-ribose/CDP-alcohol diphosphatase [Paragonimus heterotremus]|uniref:Manganese-dependent ADP-ribose/CDP-alcohol diphosphatase n=1 Tax=Paragonimus heterotremus TaxID=100268 RepID=A0A8J4TGU6_9TREM|nr:Manganese-dependent ADP-ribose/CDP-alcohol diphosphatase [Paragonimus heterotremus]
MGDGESAIRSEYMNTIFGNVYREYGLIKQPLRCCGSAYYTHRIGQECMLIVLDAYELLTLDPTRSSKDVGDGLAITKPDHVGGRGQKCCQCEAKSGNSTQFGWANELLQEDGRLNETGFQLLPRVQCAISEYQLQWLNSQLQEATRRTDNVILACHAPLHPLLVTDRSALPVNWKEILRLIMTFNCVRLVLNGRPVGNAAQPPDPSKPYQYDHGILYYSLPATCELTQSDPSAWTHLIVEMGYDFIRIKGEGIRLPQKTRDSTNRDVSEWTIPFEPRRKLSVNHFDYMFNGGYDY